MDVISTIVPIEINILPENLVYLLNSTGEYEHICFFDSSLAPNKYSKYSYVCWEPMFVVQSNRQESTFLNCLSGEKQTFDINPLLFLKEISNSAVSQNNIIYHSASEHDSDLSQKSNLPDFIGGLAGYISYDFKNYIEKLPQKAKDDIFLPLFSMAYYGNFLAYDIDNKKWFYIKNFTVKDKSNKSKKDQPVPDYFIDCLYSSGYSIGGDFSENNINEIVDIEKIRLTNEIKKPL